MKKTTWIIFSLLCFSACTQKSSQESQTAAPAPQQASASAPTAATGAASAELNLSTQGDSLYFDKKELEAKAGSTVQVNFKNISAKESNMSHNWVLVKPGTEAAVASDGLRAGESQDWVTDGPNIIAHTKLAASGQTVGVKFVVPAAGDYPYICTYPGHNLTMKGVLHVH